MNTRDPRTIIYAIHTPDVDGAPMNETALCYDHMDDADSYEGEARGADDEPESLVFTEVRDPENNDTVCNLCCLERIATEDPEGAFK